MNGEHKISSSHRERAALIYLRQSSMVQVREHTESTRSQYALADEAAALGWPRSDIEVIDTDLGISGKWGVAREGFTELVTRVCSGEVGAIFGIEITRLARSNADVARLAGVGRAAALGQAHPRPRAGRTEEPLLRGRLRARPVLFPAQRGAGRHGPHRAGGTAPHRVAGADQGPSRGIHHLGGLPGQRGQAGG